MFGYYLQLAWHSLRRSPVLSALMVLAIGLGIGASMTMLTVLHVLTANPVPARSGQLFRPQIDPQPMQGYVKGQPPPTEMTWLDAMNLLHAHKGVRQAAMSGGQVTVVPPQGVTQAFIARARYTTSDFFAMFGVPFVDGTGWSAKDDTERARVAVITERLADKLYGTSHAVGRTLRIGKYDFRVAGVIANWNPEPHFYDLSGGNYTKPEQVFLPFTTATTLGQTTMGSVTCWSNAELSGDLTKTPDCTWVQYWVQLRTPAQVAAYRQYLVNYSEQQKALGRFQRPPNVRLRNVMQWLAFNHVVPATVQLEGWLAFGFLLVCLINTVALLLVKFLRRGGELSVRRAMGASRRSIFTQLLIEAVLVGLAGGVIGLLLSLLGLWIVRQQPQQYAMLAHLDGTMLLATFVLAVVATLLAAVFPAWRACRLPPARLLKTQ
ncbi:MAG TPA: ABC transporter permease [Rhodanobacteraceae bacterium]